MKEVNSIRIIGRIRSRFNMMIWLLLLVGGSVYALWSVFGVFEIYSMSKLPIYMGSVQTVKTFLIIMIGGIVWVLISAILFLGSNQFIQVDKKNISYCEARGMHGKMRQFINAILKRKQVFDLQIHIPEIKRVRLSFSDDYFWFVLKGHTLVYDIELSDGTVIRIIPNNLYIKKDNCLSGIQYIEEQGVMVEDPYHIKKALADKTVVLGEYFDSLEKDHVS